MILQTERFILDAWQSSDWLAFRPIATNVDVMRYINGGVPWSDEQIHGFIDRQINLYRERGFCRWKILEKSGGPLLGFCGASMWRDAPDPEIGWWLAPAYWGRGVATEAARVALRDLFERAGLERVISMAMPANTASTRIMEKLGLQFDGNLESEGDQLVRYAMDRRRYAAVSGSPVPARRPRID